MQPHITDKIINERNMGIRLNKVLTELNIGLQTAVDFLKDRKELGEIKEDATSNTKISDEQHEALVKAFKGDKAVKNEADRIIAQKAKDKEKRVEKKPVTTKAEDLLAPKPTFKTVGKIDLDTLKPKRNKEEVPATNVSVEEPRTAAESPEVSQVAVEKPAPQQTEVAAHASEKEEVKSQPIEKEVEQTPQPVTVKQETEPQAPAEMPQTEVEKTVPVEEKKAEEAPKQETEKATANKIFTLRSENKPAPKVNVLGKIDLDALNQSTRPKKKSKEERKKEREEKAAMQRGGNASGERKKRVRIGKERVDIENAGAQTANAKGKQRFGGAGKPGSSPEQQGGGKRNKKGHSAKPLEVNEEDVARQVKETLARLTSKTQNKKGAKYRREKREAVQERMNEEREEMAAESKTLKLTEFVTVSELATMMNVPVNKVIGTCMSIGIMVSINQRLDAETINLVAEEFGFSTEYVSAEVSEAIQEEEDDENDLVPRAPIVTVMGHVDHGKTSLLDHIRSTNVIAGEAGGITQHIGAYNVKLSDGRRITFLDTPGHEAFTAMRARGAQVTDIAIIIVAADDSVMPTTKEAIAHAQAANVPMVFAINKIDKPGANPDKIREDLSQMNLLVEEWGGKYQCQEISAKKGIGVEDLLEKVLLEAEMLDLKANPNRKATGSIIESSLDKGRGYVSTVLVSNGTLKVGDVVVAGTSYGRIKAMFNERNQRMEKASPAEPAIILGLNGAPTAGDSFHVMETEQEAREIANKRLQLQREQGLRTQTRLTLADISHRIALGSFKELNLIVKGDTDGSIEALSDSFIRMSTEKIKVNVIHKAVGQISENDVQLADASDAIIVGFQVRPSSAARKLADNEGVEINTYSIIYDAIEDIKSAMEGMLDKVKKEVVTGQVEVREVYKISKVGTVAGAMVTEGKVHRSDKARLVRDGIVVHTGEINALKRYKDDVKEVATNFECGISLVNFNDIQQGDIIETFTEIEVQQKL